MRSSGRKPLLHDGSSAVGAPESCRHERHGPYTPWRFRLRTIAECAKCRHMRKKAKPAPVPVLIDEIYRDALREIKKRQKKGEKLTGADYEFVAKMDKLANDKKVAAETKPQVQTAFDVTKWARALLPRISTELEQMLSSKSEIAKAGAITQITAFAKWNEIRTELPRPRLVDAKPPQEQKITPIEDARAG